jgi:hypothetical protein
MAKADAAAAQVPHEAGEGSTGSTGRGGTGREMGACAVTVGQVGGRFCAAGTVEAGDQTEGSGEQGGHAPSLARGLGMPHEGG